MRHGAWWGFGLFLVILYIYLTFLVPFLTAPLGGVFSFLGGLASFVSFVVIAGVGYWIYAFSVKKTGAEPEA